MNISRELYDEISNLTQTDYKAIYSDDADVPVMVTEIESMLIDLLDKYRDLEHKYDETEKYYIDNWQPIPVSKQVGMVDKDFC